jgi:predicted DNA-binding transcriptional regulator AlpA
MSYMNKKAPKQNGAGSPQTSPSNQPITGFNSTELLTRAHLAARWGCCRHTIARRKDLHPIRLGRRLVRYRLAEIQAIEAKATGGEGAPLQ